MKIFVVDYEHQHLGLRPCKPQTNGATKALSVFVVRRVDLAYHYSMPHIRNQVSEYGLSLAIFGLKPVLDF